MSGVGRESTTPVNCRPLDSWTVIDSSAPTRRARCLAYQPGCDKHHARLFGLKSNA